MEVQLRPRAPLYKFSFTITYPVDPSDCLEPNAFKQRFRWFIVNQNTRVRIMSQFGQLLCESLHHQRPVALATLGHTKRGHSPLLHEHTPAEQRPTLSIVEQPHRYVPAYKSLQIKLGSRLPMWPQVVDEFGM
uniref:Uncharacterized protein n=1 Tax=Anopheles atroparvus TaxID=41427 RepID=A0AAG5DGC1_ANOAO